MVWALLVVGHGNRAIFTGTAKEVGKLMMLLIVYRYHQQKGLTMIQGPIANWAFTYDNWVLSWVYQRKIWGPPCSVSKLLSICVSQQNMNLQWVNTNPSTFWNTCSRQVAYHSIPLRLRPFASMCKKTTHHTPKKVVYHWLCGPKYTNCSCFKPMKSPWIPLYPIKCPLHLTQYNKIPLNRN